MSRTRKPKSSEQIQHDREIGKRMTRARLRASDQYSPLTQAELAEIANLSERSIGLYERGEVSVGSFALKQLAKALRVKVQWLLYGSDTCTLTRKD